MRMGFDCKEVVLRGFKLSMREVGRGPVEPPRSRSVPPPQHNRADIYNYRRIDNIEQRIFYIDITLPIFQLFVESHKYATIQQ